MRAVGPGPRAWDSAEFTEFVQGRARPMLAMARGLAASDADAEDLVQDVLAQVLLKWDVVRRADSPAAYVNRMLVNASISWRRRAVVRREKAVPGDELRGAVMADPTTELGEREAVLAVLRRLPARNRAVLVLRYYEGMPDEEIARVLGMAHSTVRSNAARGLRALRANPAVTELFGQLTGR